MAKVAKPAGYKAPKVSLPKPKAPKAMSMTTKAPKTSMSGYSSASKTQNGLKGAISKNQMSQLDKANLDQSY